MADWGFKNLGLHKIWACIRPENAAIIKVIERIGFKSRGLSDKIRLSTADGPIS